MSHSSDGQRVLVNVSAPAASSNHGRKQFVRHELSIKSLAHNTDLVEIVAAHREDVDGIRFQVEQVATELDDLFDPVGWNFA